MQTQTSTYQTRKEKHDVEPATRDLLNETPPAFEITCLESPLPTPLPWCQAAMVANSNCSLEDVSPVYGHSGHWCFMQWFTIERFLMDKTACSPRKCLSCFYHFWPNFTQTLHFSIHTCLLLACLIFIDTHSHPNQWIWLNFRQNDSLQICQNLWWISKVLKVEQI